MEKKKYFRKPKIQFFSKEHIKKDTKRKITRWTTVFIIIVIILIAVQFIFMKWQISKYQLPYYEDVDTYREYACVQMSYDAEKAWEEAGFHVVQRRVMNEHRWVAIEMLPGIYVEFESTLNLLGMHLITQDMTKQTIYQSEGFFKNGTRVVDAPTSLSMHGALTDWKQMWYEKEMPNIGYFSWVIWPS